MDEVIVVSMIFSLIMVTLIGGFILLFPLTRRLGAFLERRLEEGSGRNDDPRRVQAIHGVLEDLRGQIEDLRERQEFVEKLVEGRSAEALPDPGDSADREGAA